MHRTAYVNRGCRVLFNGKTYEACEAIQGLSLGDYESLQASGSVSATPVDGRMPTELVTKAFDEVAHQLAIRTDEVLRHLPGSNDEVAGKPQPDGQQTEPGQLDQAVQADQASQADQPPKDTGAPSDQAAKPVEPAKAEAKPSPKGKGKAKG